jgi:flagellar FliL protein
MTTSTAEKTETEEETSGSGGKLKKIAIVVVVVLLVAAAAWWFVLRPKPEKAPEPGEIVTLDSTQINLTGGHYLRLGLALQLTTEAHEVDGSKALDAAIDLFSGRTMASISQPARRDELKAKLAHQLDESYHGEVMDVYFTEFVTQ